MGCYWFHFVDRAQRLSGNGRIMAKVVTIENTHWNAKAGLMLRENLGQDSKNAMVCLRPSSANGVRFQYRSSTGGGTYSSAKILVAAPYWLRLERDGNTFTGYCSLDGSSWVTVGSANIAMDNDLYIGMGVTSHNTGTLCTATFQHVTVE